MDWSCFIEWVKIICAIYSFTFVFLVVLSRLIWHWLTKKKSEEYVRTSMSITAMIESIEICILFDLMVSQCSRISQSSARICDLSDSILNIICRITITTNPFSLAMPIDGNVLFSSIDLIRRRVDWCVSPIALDRCSHSLSKGIRRIRIRWSTL